MPFIAIDKKTGDRVDITKLENPWQNFTKGNLECQLCKKPMHPRVRMGYMSHFCHYAECDNNTYKKGEKETLEHLFGKQEIARMLREQFSDPKIKIEFEWPLEEIKRIVDVYVLFPMGWSIAHEIQLSPISEEEIEERTNDYESIGIDVIWWLGEKAAPRVKDWCFRRFGRMYTIKFIKDEQDRFIKISDV